MQRSICILLLLLTLSARADVLLRVRPHIVVAPESEVHLSQLIDVQSLSAESQERLAQTPVLRAPELGERQTLSSSSLVEVLREVVELERRRGGQKLHVVLPKSVVIDTVKRELTAEVVGQELTQAWQPLCADCQLTVESVSLPKVDDVRDWTLKVKAELPRGSFSVPVELVRENGAHLPAWISGRLVAKRKVPVARRLMNIGERLQSEDVSWEFRDIAFSYDGIPTADEIPSLHLRQGMRAGDILWSRMLEKDRAVRRGEMVQIKSRSGIWEVSLNVVAQQDAYVGDVVNLKNPKTGAMLMGEVVGQGEVELK